MSPSARSSASRRRPLTDVWLAIASGLLLALAAPGFGAGALAWIALVPLYRAISGAGLPRAAFLGWLTGFAFAAATFWWVVLPIALHTRLGLVGGIAAASALTAVHAVPIAAYGAALALWERKLDGFGICLAATLWTAIEWSRTLGPMPLPWGLLGYSQPASSAIAQIAEWTGVYGISAVIVLVNAAIHVGTRRSDTTRWTAVRLASVTIVVVAAFSVGEWRRAAERLAVGGTEIRVGVVQPALAPGIDGPDATAVGESLTRSLANVPLDVVVWPEGAAPFVLADDAVYDAFGAELADDRRARERLLALARELARPIVVGVGAVEKAPRGRGESWTSRNRVASLEPNGTVGASVDKRILVPFGEIVPGAAAALGVESIVPGRGGYRSGSGTRTLAIGPVTAAVAICWEAIFPRFVAESAGEARWLLDLTNDAWLVDGIAAEQHLAMAAMRAVETRRPLVRAANSGISAFIGADGRIRERTRFGDRTVVTGEIRPRSALTFYVRHGDVFAIGTALAAVGLLVYAGGSRPRGEEPAVLPLT